MTALASTGFLRVGASDLEYRMIGPAPDQAPTVVMLHEGLGSSGLWGDFPDKLQAATNAGVFVYSRAGYGASTAVALPRPLDYMHIEALEVLPKLLDRIGFGRGILLGHSDGASIAAIYAGGHQDHRVQGVAMIAPHFIVEDVSVTSIAEIKHAYETSSLRAKLERWHGDVDNAFYGWNGAWLNPEFRD
jgi:pimeloyl-ACP methyl ester carboxylesterase